MSAALRQQRHRDRIRSGKILLTIEVDAVEVAEMLVGAGLLSALMMDCPRAIALALACQVQALCDLSKMD
jgi:hypothetical protein